MNVSARPAPDVLTGRAALAVEALKLSNRLSRALGRGRGTVAGGRVGLALDPTLLATLARGRRVALVSGTNGKTTTTRMLAAAMAGERDVPVATNDTGANMPAGHVSALAGSSPGADAVLEVDEGYLGRLIAETSPRVVVLLNLSRDQLDRISEVRMLVDRWRAAMAGLPARTAPDGEGTVVVANADDPMVVWAAATAPDVRWVGAGQVWQNDAVGCPACGGGIEFDEQGGWACDRCDFARPPRVAWLDGTDLVTADGGHYPVDIKLPGGFNRANAAMVAVAAPVMAGGDGSPGAAGPPLTESTALARLSGVDQVEGRFARTTRNGHPVRLLLAKNPAGWTAIFDLLDEDGRGDAPVVLSINARIADGLDTSWLWDVPFERLAGRPVVATGDRRLDLAVRLRYAEVPSTVVADPLAALDRAMAISPSGAGGRPGAQPAGGVPIDFLGNYTAFAELRSRL
ncbi:MAG: MurT ligase domain-containing protein [Acidimicrobiales bacterium]